MTLPRLQAVAFVKRLESGRSRPGLFRCETPEGHFEGEYVVKLRASLESGTVAFAFEALGATLARKLGLTVPDSAQVEIDALLADAIHSVDPEAAGVVRRSTGLNFRSKYLRGLPTWGEKQRIPTALRERALEVFAFDALIQNPDRKTGNPNLLAGSSEIVLIDHEAAFSFYYALGEPVEPWKVSKMPFPRDHVFFSGLRGRIGSLDRFQDRLSGISDGDLEAMLSMLPDEWRDDRLSVVLDHSRKVRDHADEFLEEVRRVLR